MALFYKPSQSAIATKDGEKLWYPVLIKVGKIVDTITLAESIAEKSAMTPGDVLSVVRNLMTTMRTHLLDSKSVRLDGLGTFTIKASASGNGVKTAEEVSASQIRMLKCQFTPEYSRNFGNTTRALLKGVEFSNLLNKDVAASDNSGSAGEGGSGDNGLFDPSV